MKWININKELPKEEVEYQQGGYPFMTSERVQIHYQSHNINQTTIGYLSLGVWYDDMNRKLLNVTHWYPLLPALKKRETQEINPNRMTRTQLIKVLFDSKGKRCSIIFIKEDKSERKLNGLFTGKQAELGNYYFKIKEGLRQFNPNNLLEVRVNKTIYKVK